MLSTLWGFDALGGGAPGACAPGYLLSPRCGLLLGSQLCGWMLVFAFLCVSSRQLSAAEPVEWKRSPYRVHVEIGVDTVSRPEARLGASIAKTISERIEALIAPLWEYELKQADDLAARRQCLEVAEIGWEQLPAQLKSFDKLIWLGIQSRPGGYELRCREFDAYTRRWGPVRRRMVRQTSYLPEAGFDAIVEASSPVALVEPIADDEKQVRLVFRGCELPKQTKDDVLVKRGEVLQPLLRRTDRSGKLMAAGIVEVPYTYLLANEPKDDAWLADIYSGTRRPFAAERRARIEQIAVALRNAMGPSTVRFFARSDKSQGLAGYEVFITAEDGSEKRLGLTDRQGTISIPAGEKPVSTIVMRSEGQLMAKAPIPAGAPETIQIPVADSTARLRAQGEAQVLREQLVDVVARRTLLAARIRALIKKGKSKEAAQLMDELDSLPSSSAFGRNIDAAAKRIPPGKDPAVQHSIDRLFSTTRELLAKFLNNRPIIDLQNEVNAASRGGS
jgi:hypothetical protein